MYSIESLQGKPWWAEVLFFVPQPSDISCSRAFAVRFKNPYNETLSYVGSLIAKMMQYLLNPCKKIFF